LALRKSSLSPRWGCVDRIDAVVATELAGRAEHAADAGKRVATRIQNRETTRIQHRISTAINATAFRWRATGVNQRVATDIHAFVDFIGGNLRCRTGFARVSRRRVAASIIKGEAASIK